MVLLWASINLGSYALMSLKVVVSNSIRYLSVTKTQITPLLTLREVRRKDQSENNGLECKPLVLMFDWLYAPQTALSKYCDLYHNLGLDVITVKGKSMHFLWPPRGEELAKSLMNHIMNERPNREKVLVHAFSVGAYNYTICKTLGLEQPELYGAFRAKIVGQIYDSIVLGSYDNMSTGIAAAFHGSGNLTKPIIALMNLYYNITNKRTQVVYDKLVRNFRESPITVPTLIYYSHNDPMCDVPTMEEMIVNWQNDFPYFDVTVKSWEKSVHAAHLKFHRDEYLACWKNLINKVVL